MARTPSKVAEAHRELFVDPTGDFQLGADVLALQRAVNARLRARKQFSYVTEEDGEYGPGTAKAVKRAAFLLGAAMTTVNALAPKASGRATIGAQRLVRLDVKRSPAQLARASVRKVSPPPLRESAYQIAANQVGIMESGCNNCGTPFNKFERPNGAAGPEPWCGDFVAFCYREAGSKRVSRSWAAVRLIRGLVGVFATSKPKRGDLVRFDFEGPGSLSHVGIFVRDLGNGMIETIEGNTGPSGAVSDSTTGGDGVYRKHRSKTLVHDYLHVGG